MGIIVSAVRDGKTIRIDSVASKETQTVSARLITRFKSIPRNTAVRILSVASGSRLYRKLYSIIIRPFVKYEIHPAEQHSGKPGTQSTWDWLNAYLFGR